MQNIEIAINFAMHLPFNVLHKCNVINFNASLNRNMFNRETNIAPMYIYIYIYIYIYMILFIFYANFIVIHLRRNWNKLSIKYQSSPKSRKIDTLEQNTCMRHNSSYNYPLYVYIIIYSQEARLLLFRAKIQFFK